MEILSTRVKQKKKEEEEEKGEEGGEKSKDSRGREATFVQGMSFTKPRLTGLAMAFHNHGEF